MLQNEPTAETINPIGHNRVTPDELSRALAAIESRKQAEAQRLAGTIPIAEAVSQLHLDATPEEIWAEVQSQRDKPPAPEPKTFEEADAARRAQAAQARLAQSPAKANVSAQSGGRRWKGIRVAAPLFFVWLLFHNGLIAEIQHHLAPPSHAVLEPLTRATDGQEVYADDTALVQISEGKPAAQIAVSENAAGNRWKLVKMGDHVYLRGFTASVDSLSSLQGKALNVYNDNNSGGLYRVPTSNVTLRLDKVTIHKSGGDNGYSEITVPNFQPDSLTTLDAGR